MSAKAIRAGAAFVEIFMKDESVKRSMADLKMRWQAFGATVNSVGSDSFTAMNSSSSAALSATAASAATATAGTALIGSAVYATANAFRVLFSTVTSGVTRAAVNFRMMSYIIRDIFPKGGAVQNAFDKLLNSSGMVEKSGRWARLVGLVTGNSFLRGFGVRVERFGMGAAIERGFRDGGFAGYLKAYIGAGFRSVPSWLTGLVARGVTAPFRAAFSVLSGGAGKAAVSISQVSSVTGGAAAAVAKLTTPTLSFAGAAVKLASAIPRIAMAAAKVGGIAALITGPAFLAARGFATAATEIRDKAKETGESIQSLIDKKYGSFSFITPADIAAGAALSDSFKELKQQTASAFAQLGIAAMPVLKQITETMTAAMRIVTRYVAQNRELITTVIRVAAKMGSFAAAVSAVAFAFPMVLTAASALLSPIGLVATALAGLAYLFPSIRTAAADTFAFLFPNFRELLTITNSTIHGIMDALQGGSFEAASEVLWSGLNVAWLAGTESLREITRSLFADFRAAWVITGKFIGDVFQTVLAGMRSAWMVTQNAIAGGLARLVAKMSGQDVNEVLETLNEMQGQQAKDSSEAFGREMANREKAATDAMLEIENGFRESNEASKAGLDAARARHKEAVNAARILKEEALKARVTKGAENAKSLASGLASGFGSFSARAANQIGISGVSKLEDLAEKTAKNTEETVAAIKGMSGAVYA